MFRKTFGHITLCIVLIAALSGCAGLQGGGGVPPSPPEAEAKLMEANRALYDVKEQLSVFYTQQASALQEIKEFRGRPGWNEFEQILLEYPSLKDPDNEVEIEGVEARLSEWSLKWKTSWKKTLENYYNLVDECSILEAKKAAVRQKLLAVQAKYLTAVVMEASAGRAKQGKEIYSVAESLDKSNEELNSCQPDDMGLYVTGPSR
ncbi:MAG: hypothetical protein ACLQBD_25435 [Syntrophobacteraceae bacterium]